MTTFKRVANSLETLRKQINARWPDRSRISDGGLGDTSHAARLSDHNPNAEGIVCARDFTHDPVHGPDARKLAEHLLSTHDKRIKYIISNGEIASGLGANHTPWVWRPYTGMNAHRHHMHISVRSPDEFYDDSSEWDLKGL